MTSPELIPLRYGNAVNFWLQYPTYIDISRGAARVQVMQARELPIVLDPMRSVVVVIDMQNFFLSAELGRSDVGRKCVDPIIQVLGKAREVGMRVIWLNWGVRHDLANLPPNVIRSFSHGSPTRGFGTPLPSNMGPTLVAGSRNAELYPPLAAVAEPSDIHVSKHRTSGFWGTELEQLLHAQGITTLFFAGVNTDQCVFGTLQDAHCLGYDCVLLTDCTATTSPPGAYESVVQNCEKAYGFVVRSEEFVGMIQREKGGLLE